MNLPVPFVRVGQMTVRDIGKVEALEGELLKQPQVSITTRHVFHAGLYARTITIPAGCALTGVHIKRATLLIISGHAAVYMGGEQAGELQGYHVIPASAGRKQAYFTFADTDVTMVFPTTAITVGDAEREFTDEFDRLLSKHELNEIISTGE